MMKWIKKNSPWLITALSTVVSLVLWIVFQNHPNMTSFFINLTAGFLISTFTICIIERILKRQREQDLLPIQLAMYRDVQLFTSKIISLWERLYVQSTENKDKKPIKELFAKETTDLIISSLDIDQKMQILPEMSICEYIIYQNPIITDLGKTILERYSYTASPEILQIIHYLIIDSCFIGERLNNIQKIKYFSEKRILSLPSTLTYYLINPTERDRQEITRLIDWCNTKYEEYKDKSNTIYEINQEFGDTKKVYF